ncbi:oxygen-dependent protoporphyrinogen oxidase [Cyberlindnera jadinii NRRL Y-1542]|uniref:Protoporphyrinogen oxidase n=1 Tax=Cyberlindnera jadinii (strain ATCC 18201 / CBS 1600 / BCRC 20928 / JCM 3617 / NBRC 0987 / NRRL Y-1542) TaxID=983966 RepID=A0A1E4RW01_CYBJN|nr:Protoporphyrinogen oxidase [Cyberlindnera jadinii NRRL Y-1542]ODV71462.1 Protoporphyrinogen oxidase [Cyberlindnera jadinii NRRL Y-1542]
MSLKPNARVAVIGSGISGLSFTYFLSKLRPDVSITVYDSQPRVGGYICSQLTPIDEAHVTLEKGPRTLRGASDGTVLIIDTLLRLGQKDKINVIKSDSIANRKYLLSSETLLQVPNSFKTLIRFLRNPLGKGLIQGALKEPFVKASSKDDESVRSFLTRRFGHALPDNVLSAVFHGIYAGDIDKLSAKSTLKSMFNSEKKYGSIIRSIFNKKDKPSTSSLLSDYQERFKPEGYSVLELSKFLKNFPMITMTDGLSTLPLSIAKALEAQPNVCFKLNTDVNSLAIDSNQVSVNNTSYDHVRSTINASKLFQLIQNSETGAIASKVHSINILLINLYIKKDILPYHGFGYLVPMSNPNPFGLLGVIFDSEVEKGCVPLFNGSTVSFDKEQVDGVYSPADYTKLTIMCGGHYHDDRPFDGDIDALTRNCIDAAAKQLGIRLNTDNTHIEKTYIEKCIPQYNVGYESLKRDFDKKIQLEFKGMLSQGGMSFGDGIGVPDCFGQGYKGAVELAKGEKIQP